MSKEFASYSSRRRSPRQPKRGATTEIVLFMTSVALVLLVLVLLMVIMLGR